MDEDHPTNLPVPQPDGIDDLIFQAIIVTSIVGTVTILAGICFVIGLAVEWLA
jgi:uncharacterized membrane protein YphA (DoxX/SURF4 family)